MAAALNRSPALRKFIKECNPKFNRKLDGMNSIVSERIEVAMASASLIDDGKDDVREAAKEDVIEVDDDDDDDEEDSDWGENNKRRLKRRRV